MGMIRSVYVRKIKKVPLLRFALKTAVGGGAIYYTIHKGIWSKPEESVKSYESIRKTISNVQNIPYIKENIPIKSIELPPMLSTGGFSNVMKPFWNKQVIVCMKFLSEVPRHTTNTVNSLVEKAQTFINKTMAS